MSLMEDFLKCKVEFLKDDLVVVMIQRDILKAELEAVKRERDAAVADLRKGASCEMCAHGHECRYPDDYKACKMRGSRKWEWRGLCKENGGAEDGRRETGC